MSYSVLSKYLNQNDPTTGSLHSCSHKTTPYIYGSLLSNGVRRLSSSFTPSYNKAVKKLYIYDFSGVIFFSLLHTSYLIYWKQTRVKFITVTKCAIATVKSTKPSIGRKRSEWHNLSVNFNLYAKFHAFYAHHLRYGEMWNHFQQENITILQQHLSFITNFLISLVYLTA